jgi:thiol-disulfide isomerase/thioredoxin
MIFRFTAMLAVALVAATPAAAQDNAPTMGRSVATLARVPLKARSGTSISLGSRVASGKPTLIAIWASWCPPCIAEAPYFAKMRKDLGGGYNFLYVNRQDGNPDPDQPPEAVAQFLGRAGLGDVDYVVADVKAYRQIVGPDIKTIPDGLVGIPRVYLFDRNGRQIYTAFGFDPADALAVERRLQQAMAR